MKEKAKKSTDGSKRAVPKKNPSTIKMTYKGAITMEELMTKLYGKRGTKKRDAVDKRIKQMAEKSDTQTFLMSARQSQNLTQKQVAKIMNVDDSVVSRLEKNFNKSSLETILRYAKAINVKHVNLEFHFENEPPYKLKLNTGL